jgi:MFS family permease
MPPQEENSDMSRKDIFTVFFLLVNALTWWFALQIVIEDTLIAMNASDIQTIIVLSSFFGAIVGSGIIGSVLANRVERFRLLYAWTILGAIITILPAILRINSFIQILVISGLFGASFGVGMPSALALFADWTRVESRGRMGGVVLLLTNLSAIPFILLFTVMDVGKGSAILALWRGLGLVILFLKAEKKESVTEKKKSLSFSSIIHSRTFVLYFVAWFLFCFIDRFETPIQKEFLGDLYELSLEVGPIIGSIAALVGGALADRIGRKRVILVGFVSMGIAYAVIGIINTPEIAWYLSISILSIAAGIIWVIFVMVLWGDLAKYVRGEKYYALGTIPFFLTNIVQLLSDQYFREFEITSAFSLAAFFLFMAVLPLVYAPETLPEKKMELRRLRSFAEDAKKAKEKYERKMKKKKD